MTFIPEIIAKVNHPMAGRRRAEQFNLMKEVQSGALWWLRRRKCMHCQTYND